MKFLGLILASLVVGQGPVGSVGTEVGPSSNITCDQIQVIPIGHTNTSDNDAYLGVAPHVQVNSQTILFGLWTNATVETQVPLTVTTSGCAGVTFNVTHYALTCDAIWNLNSTGRVKAVFLNGNYFNVNFTATSNVSDISLAPTQDGVYIDNDLSSNLTTITPVAFNVTTYFCPTGVIIDTTWFPPSCGNLEFTMSSYNSYSLTDVYGTGGFNGSIITASDPSITVESFMSYSFYLPSMEIGLRSDSESIIYANITVHVSYCTQTYSIVYVPNGQSIDTSSTATSTYYPPGQTATPSASVPSCQTLTFYSEASMLINTLTITLAASSAARTFTITDSEGVLEFTPDRISFPANSNYATETVTFMSNGATIPSGTIVILTDHIWCAKFIKYLALIE